MKFPTSTLALLMPHLIPNSRTQRQWQASKATLFSSEVGRPMSAGPSRNDFSCAWWLKSAFRRWATAGNVKLLLPPRQSRGASLGRLALKARHPCLLITDVKLAGKMNGIELAQLARKNDPALRVVVISGQQAASVLPDGVTFLSKPVHPTTLIREAVP